MREIVLDTETTGFDPEAGHRLVEIGCIELYNLMPTGKTFWTYLNPERDIPEDATRVHGITNEFVQDKPKFIEQVDAFLEFIGDSPVIAHNASFDFKFINAELIAHKYMPMPWERAIDTVAMARKKFPGQGASLDALCRRFGIDNSNREKHGALLDAELLAQVYLELKGGRQPDLAVEVVKTSVALSAAERVYRAPRTFAQCSEELAAHKDFIAKLPNALWAQWEADEENETALTA